MEDIGLCLECVMSGWRVLVAAGGRVKLHDVPEGRRVATETTTVTCPRHGRYVLTVQLCELA